MIEIHIFYIQNYYICNNVVTYMNTYSQKYLINGSN